MVVNYSNEGLVPYRQCWEKQEQLFAEQVKKHIAGDSSDNIGTILVVEHCPVYTIGKSGNEKNMLLSAQALYRLGASLIRIDRGGDITFHGPGQIVIYPIIDLSKIDMGLRDYIWHLEQAVIDTVALYGIVAGRDEGATGVWLYQSDKDGVKHNLQKICAIGVRASHFVTMHGAALNVNTDLSWFGKINPCGFTDRGVCSIESIAGKKIDIEQVKMQLLTNLAKQLGVKLQRLEKA